MYGTCGGALVLAEAGLLGGQTATTHWVYEPVFRKFFPDVKLNMERVLVQGGPGHNLVCGGGASSWQDLALLLVSKYGGTEEAIRMSKLFLYQWHRDGQLPYASMVQNVDHGDGVILKCQDWIAQHYSGRTSSRSWCASRDCRSVRSTAAFALPPDTRRSPTYRRCASKRQSSCSKRAARPVEQVGREVGYEDAASFRRLFRRLTGIGPSDYRRKFQPPAIVGRAQERAASSARAVTR